jgi:hypothetical protein
MSIRISNGVPAKDCAGMALLRSFAQSIVKARQDNVVLVQDMHPVTARSLNASVPSIRQASVFGFAVEHHSPRANAANNFGSCIIAGAVVDYFDLHLVRAQILLKHAA